MEVAIHTNLDILGNVWNQRQRRENKHVNKQINQQKSLQELKEEYFRLMNIVTKNMDSRERDSIYRRRCVLKKLIYQ